MSVVFKDKVKTLKKRWITEAVLNNGTASQYCMNFDSYEYLQVVQDLKKHLTKGTKVFVTSNNSIIPTNLIHLKSKKLVKYHWYYNIKAFFFNRKWKKIPDRLFIPDEYDKEVLNFIKPNHILI